MADIVFAKINTEEHQEIAGHFNIRSIPTLMIFRDQIIIFSQPGALPESQFRDLLAKAGELDMAEVKRQIAAQSSDTPSRTVDGIELRQPASMQRACHPWATACILSGRPNVGALMSLCEENFARLSVWRRIWRALGRLHLALRRRGRALPRRRRASALHDLYSSHLFLPRSGNQLCDPDARLRVYHDARQVEVIDLRQTILPLRTDYRSPALAEKWQVNLFIGKWLDLLSIKGMSSSGRRSSARSPKPAQTVATLPFGASLSGRPRPPESSLESPHPSIDRAVAH
jgi:uncharacterized protein